MSHQRRQERRKRRPLAAIGDEWRILLGVAAFFLIVVIMFFFLSNEPNETGSKAAGTVLLVFTVFLGALPGCYIASWSWRMKHPRPEDRDDGTFEEGAGPVGTFPDSSIWPFIIGLAAALCIVGFVFPIWLALLGGGLAIGAIAGVVVESRRGGTV